MSKGRNRSKGFSLVELLVVIAIIGILAAIATPNAFKAIEKGKVAAAEADYRAIKSATLSYYGDTGAWPTGGTGGTGFMTDPAVTGWNGSYLEAWPTKNPWGGTYAFTSASGAGALNTPQGALANHSYKWITLTTVSSEGIAKIETDIDGAGGSASTGVVRSSGTTLFFVVSTD